MQPLSVRKSPFRVFCSVGGRIFGITEKTADFGAGRGEVASGRNPCGLMQWKPAKPFILCAPPLAFEQAT